MASDIEKREASPTDEDFDKWWLDYTARVKESVDAAEQHLEVPAGTISSIPSEPDFIATVKTYAVIEPVLNQLIAACPPRGRTFVGLAPPDQFEDYPAFVAALNMSGRTGKLKLAAGLGLITQDRVRFIEGLSLVRNRYAHNVKNMHRSLTEILSEEQQSNARIVKNLTGIEFALSPSSNDRNELLRILMYYRLSDFLADALQTLRPPPPPEGGLLSGLLGSLAKSDTS